MPLDVELTSWLVLSQVRGLGYESYRKLLQIFGSPSAILSSPSSTLQQYVKPALAKAISAEKDNEFLDQVAAWLEDSNNHIVTLADTEYPQALLNIADPPFLLYIKGRLDLLNHSSLAIVGSRNATTQGARNAESFAEAISAANFCIVSGMAQGIDTAAHIGGLKGQGASIAVVGTGLDKVYPSSNHELAHQLAQQGTLISEFPLGTPPLPANFPRRNRIISGLAAGCLVVEASLQSGSLITARLALEQGREVFAIPGSIHSPQAKGCHSLIKQGARLVETPQEILEDLNMASPGKLANPDTPNNHPLLDQMGFDPIDLNTLSQASNLTIENLSAILLQLELEGLISCVDGGKYQRLV